MKAHELLAQDGAWTQYSTAYDTRGIPVEAHSEKAVCWCLEGAIIRCYDNFHIPIQPVLAALEAKGWYGQACHWNDRPERTQAEVVALLKGLDI